MTAFCLMKWIFIFAAKFKEGMGAGLNWLHFYSILFV